ncbi:amino acid adenylation domain-containing protein [Streptomyces sp. NPDC018026]|uniref:amino acid adenylation domain-containing protein n=1 Tax=Streptomyces sp. NPDC018026 TaxID=3365031 RepID=UPI0037910D26
MAELTPAQQDLMRRLLARRFDDDRGGEIPRRVPGVRVGLTSAQASIWFSAQLFPDSPEYNVFDVLRVHHAVTEAGLSAALRTLVERHDALRLRFVVDGGEPHQEDLPPFTPEVAWFDLRSHPAERAGRLAEELANECARVLLPIDGHPLFKVSAIALPAGDTLVVLVLHHVIADYVTEAVLMGELSRLLAGEPLGPPPRTGFLDYAAWSGALADPAEAAADLEYWKTVLRGDLSELAVPRDRPRPPHPSRRGHSVALEIPPHVTAALRKVAQQRGTTMFTVFLAIYYVLLARLGGQSDVIVGTALAGRDHPGLERMAGCFVKTVALRTQVEQDMSFLDVVDAVHLTVIGAQDHQATPFERVVDALGVPRQLGVHPVFQTYFGFLSDPDERVTAAEVNPIKLLNYDASKWDMSLSLWETASGVDGIMESSQDLFDHDTVVRHCEIYLHLCSGLARRPAVGIGSHPLVPDAEVRRILYSLNDHADTRVADATLARPFERQAARTPDAVAVVADDRTLTYRRLDTWANRLAHVLQEMGAQRVALLMERGADLLVALYAIAKSGAAYVPLEPGLPPSRLDMMLRDTDPQVVITDAAGLPDVPEGPWTAVAFASLDERCADRPDSAPHVPGAGGKVSHLLYTSGSTGRPKAVACTVATAIADIHWMQRNLDYDSDDAVLFKTSYGFDTSLWEIFWPLYTGARIVVCPPGHEKDPVRLAEVIERHQVTVVDLTPTVLQAFLEELRPERCTSLRYLHTGGELVTASVRDAFRARSNARLINGYGPTETGCVAHTVLDTDAGATVPVGRPHRHARIHVLDDALNVVPVGVPGEAYISAGTIAQGYHNRPELTAERFLPDPYGPPGRRMYRTGDLCRYRPDGTLEVLGRRDGQVKIRGLRVELGEVEAVLRRHPDVLESAVVTIGAGADLHLAAFVRLRAGATVQAPELRAFVARELPRHMVPVAVQSIERVPVSVNGKADHFALRRMWRGAVTASKAETVPPADDRERALADIYADVLGLPQVGVTDDFFELGGHSLLIFRLIAKCEERLHVRPQVADVFAAPSVRELAGRLRTAPPDPVNSLVPLAPGPGKPLLVCVHAVSGSAAPFLDLARSLGEDFSTYGLEAPDGAEGGRTPSVADLAARYVAAVDRVRGFSPVFLAGWSMGGSVALEMARLWRRRGLDVAGLLLLDSWPPAGSLPDEADRARARAMFDAVDMLETEGGGTALAETPGELDRLRRVAAANMDAYLAFTPERYGGEAHLLRASEEPGETRRDVPAVYESPDRGWARLVDTVTVHDVPGSHHTLIRGDNARALAAVIRRIGTADTSFAEL